jgi:hypothetical protein
MRASTGVYAIRRAGLLALLGLLIAVGVYASSSLGRDRSTPVQTPRPRSHFGAPTPTARPAAAPPPRLLVSAPTHLGSGWSVVAAVHGQPAAWTAERRGASLMRFDQTLLRLDLHAGSSDGGISGWRYGDRVNAREVHSLVAGFNGGFKLAYRDVGFLAGHHIAVPLKSGLASIVTYTDGTSNIGAWRAGVPSAGHTVYSVLQNQHLLVDRGRAAAGASSCGQACWGETLGSVTSTARSGLGVSASGQLVWAAGEHLSPAGLADALIAAGALRAIELDINPYWVAGYLYPHHPSGPVAVGVLPGQHGIAGELLEANARDFFTVVAK